ncbi:ABC transporter ATP-binding protein [Candidatus Micrarchaeota archaeon]|nr:ABC transporter ATP-binding protein [Candidatus Micrarchaeota archaeon]
MAPVISANQIGFSFRDQSVLRDFSLDVEQNEILGLLGPSGCGKSTFLNLCTGLRSMQSGELSILGKPPNRGRLDIGFATQYDSFYEELTVRENVDYFGKLMGLSGADIADQDEIIGKAVGLTGFENHYAKQLSGGQKRRLNLWLALLAQPPILLVDEPTVGLDPTTRQSIWDLIKALQRTKTTVVFTTHYMFEAESLCDRVAILHEGQVKALGSVQALRQQFVPDELIRVTTKPGDPLVLKTLATRLKQSQLVSSVVQDPKGLLISAKEPRKVIAAVYAFLKTTKESVEFLDVQEPSFNDVFFLVTQKTQEQMKEKKNG